MYRIVYRNNVLKSSIFSANLPLTCYSVYRIVYKVNLSKKFSLKKWSLDPVKFAFTVENTVIVMFSLIIAFLQNNEF